jgi:uncharacterized NAD(P)/FAD-binding protein YdhS
MDAFFKLKDGDWINVAQFSRVTPTKVYVNGVVSAAYTEDDCKEIYQFVNQLLEKESKLTEDIQKARDLRKAALQDVREAEKHRQEWRDAVNQERQYWKDLLHLLHKWNQSPDEQKSV